MLIREATTEDWPAIWPFFHTIIAAGETLTYPLDLGKEEAQGWWYVAAPSRVVVAVDDAGTVLGTAKMNRNHMGNGSHVASATYMVDPAHSGKGSGAPCASTRSTGLVRRATGRCSSTRWSRPTPVRSSCTSPSASR